MPGIEGVAMRSSPGPDYAADADGIDDATKRDWNRKWRFVV